MAIATGSGQNHVTLSWKEVEELGGECMLQILGELKKWKTVYKGGRGEFKVEGLAPCTCYRFRIGCHDKWVECRAATQEEPFATMHLARAIQVGKMALVRKIVHSRPVLLEVENKEQKTPLLQAIEKNDIALVGLLITLGADVNQAFYFNKRTPLMFAILRNHLAIAQFLIDKGADVNASDVNKLNILHHAVDSDKLDNVQFAAKHIKDIDAADSSGWTPLMRGAILNCNEQIIEFLSAEGASRSVQDKNGFGYDKLRYLSKKF